MARGIPMTITVTVSDVLIRALENLEIDPDCAEPEYIKGFTDCQNAVLRVCKNMRDGNVPG